MEISGTEVSEERIAPLETRVREMDALVRGLTGELLDLKAIFMKLSRETGEHIRQEQEPWPAQKGSGTAAPAGESLPAETGPANTVVLKGGRRQDAPATPAPEPVMARIMQPDGTMKMEARYGDSHQTDSTSGYGPDQKINLTRLKKKS
ncbi:MAG TPA: hypothetical protein VMT44_05725 [Methanoregula sp.]|nr:hypothetical protein [Methanoregula sp.]